METVNLVLGGIALYRFLTDRTQQAVSQNGTLIADHPTYVVNPATPDEFQIRDGLPANATRVHVDGFVAYYQDHGAQLIRLDHTYRSQMRAGATAEHPAYDIVPVWPGHDGGYTTRNPALDFFPPNHGDQTGGVGNMDHTLPTDAVFVRYLTQQGGAQIDPGMYQQSLWESPTYGRYIVTDMGGVRTVERDRVFGLTDPIMPTDPRWLGPPVQAPGGFIVGEPISDPGSCMCTNSMPPHCTCGAGGGDLVQTQTLPGNLRFGPVAPSIGLSTAPRFLPPMYVMSWEPNMQGRSIPNPYRWVRRDVARGLPNKFFWVYVDGPVPGGLYGLATPQGVIVATSVDPPGGYGSGGPYAALSSVVPMYFGTNPTLPPGWHTIRRM